MSLDKPLLAAAVDALGLHWFVRVAGASEGAFPRSVVGCCHLSIAFFESSIYPAHLSGSIYSEKTQKKSIPQSAADCLDDVESMWGASNLSVFRA